MIKVDNEKCTACGMCAAVCPAVVLEQRGNTMSIAHPKSCIQCWHCIAVCPSDAVTCDEFALHTFDTIAGEPQPPEYQQAKSLLLNRRSVREFKDQEIPREILEELVTIASHAPTGHNAQGVNLCVITDRNLINGTDEKILARLAGLSSVIGSKPVTTFVQALAGHEKADSLRETREGMERFAKSAGHAHHHIFRDAPALVIAHTAPGQFIGKDDCVIALTHMMIAANSMGLGATWIGYLVGAAAFDRSIKTALGVPMFNTLQAAIILGWPKYRYKRRIPRKPVPVKWL